MLNGILQPDPSSLSSMTEYHFFKDNERDGISKLFKEMMVIKRKAEGAGLGSEEEQAEFVKEAFAKWVARKEQIKKMLLKMSESWTKEELPTAEVDYLR